jgi:hydroxysqualene dehydroxylase
VSKGRRVAVIGGGWSGLAAALELAEVGCLVELFDAAPQFGGRARRLDIVLGDRRYPLDNGQHLLIGAYRETLALMRRVGVAPDTAFVRQPFVLRYPDGFSLKAARLPAPLHLAAALLTAHGLTWHTRWAMVRAVEDWKRAHWQAPSTMSAAALLVGLPPVLIERVWEPLCVAALNVRLHEASAQVFLTVMRDSLGADRAASDLLLARADLSSLLPDAARAALQARGAKVYLRTPIQRLCRRDDGWQLTGRSSDTKHDAVVLALPPDRAADLLASVPDTHELTPVVTQLRTVRSAPIATVFLRYASGTRLPHAVSALVENNDKQHFGQWVFDRGALDPRCDGVISVVVSASGPHQALGHPELATAVAAQLRSLFALPDPLASRVVEDKRATIVPAPGLQRPPTRLPCDGLFLAGDAADSPYPSTIEGSVRSGLAAARAVSG